MLMTKETDYALRILRALSGQDQLTTKEICDQELLPQQFVYKVVKKLSQAGIIEIVRGVGGGCRLIRDLHDITLLDFINIMEADKLVSACMQSDYLCPWREQHHNFCRVHAHLCQIQEQFNAQLASYSLYTILFE